MKLVRNQSQFLQRDKRMNASRLVDIGGSTLLRIATSPYLSKNNSFKKEVL
jgi:hypothetical protein